MTSTTPTTHLPSAVPPPLTDAILHAYRQAWYEVVPTPDAEPLTLQVDVPHQRMQQVMHARGASSACVLTACNPFGQLCEPNENEARMLHCKQGLAAAGWAFAPAFGRDPLGLWPGEDSLLVWHMGRAQAREWGLRWQQNAVLWMDAKATPELLVLR